METAPRKQSIPKTYKIMKLKLYPSDKIGMALIITLFYFGDVVSTFYVLSHGGYERNLIAATMGFNMVFVLKTIVLAVIVFVVIRINNMESSHDLLKGSMYGAVIMNGLLATMINLGAII